MNMSKSRIAAGAIALAFVAGTASAQLEYYALTTDGNLMHVVGGVKTIVGNTGLNNSVNTLALNWQSRNGGGNYWTSEGFTAFAPPTGVTSHVDVSTATVGSPMYTLSDVNASLPLGGGIAYDTDGSVWQVSSNLLAGVSTLYHHAADGSFISQVDVAIAGSVGALYIRSDGQAIVGDNTGKIYVVNKANGNISSINATSLVGLTEFSTGSRLQDGFFSGSQYSSTWQDEAYAVTNSNGVASIYRINMYGNGFALVDTLDTTGMGNVWGLQVIPTPASAALLGLGGFAAMRRRRS